MTPRTLSLAILMAAPLLPAQTPDTLPPLTVVGGKDAVRQQVGGAAYISQEEIRTHGHFNVHRVLDRVPGVYVREEDGYGNFPNISIRGADGTRNEKVTVMEDGILAAPAPYTAPGAYYSPGVARMSGLEVLKGSSQVRFGPHTTGGVLNYLSTPIPDERAGLLRYTFGTDNTHLGLLQFGDTIVSGDSRHGYLVELLGQTTDGNRDFDKAGGDTGFHRVEPMAKFFWEPASKVFQRFEFKIGYTDFVANETYLGQTDADAKANPNRRYPSAQFDEMDTDHFRVSLRHILRPSESVDIEHSLYYNQFNRSWYKLDHVSTETAPEVEKSGSILGRSSLHGSLLDGKPALGVLRGEAPGSIGVKDNNREYESYGWQGAMTKRFETGDLRHALTGGLRVHHDSEKRFQYTDVFSGDGTGAFSLFRKGVPGEDADRLSETTALSVFLEDSIAIGALTLKPGARGEFLDLRDDNRGKVATGSLETWAAGMGLNYELSATGSLFGGVYRGISTPGPGAYLNDGVDVEESISYEIGFRHQQNDLALEIALFAVDYQNLVGTDTGLGVSDNNQNAGEASVYGVEALAGFNLAGPDRGFRLPAYVSATYTQAELDETLASGGAEDIYAGGKAGADLPYVPEWKIAAGVGYDDGLVTVNLDASWVDESYGTANNLTAPAKSSREGLTDALFVVDLSGSYRLSETLRLLAGVRNLTDEDGITSRIPHGARTHAPRSGYLGFELAW